MDTETRSCTQCGRSFDVPGSGYGRNRRKCYTCAPKTVLAPVTSIPGDFVPESAPSTAPLRNPEVKGPFQTKCEEILESYPDHDEAKALAATAMARALDSPDTTGAQIANLATRWLAIMEQIKAETPPEPDEADSYSASARKKLGLNA